MALSRRTGARFQASIWPGFVDAMTGLLLVLMFVLTIFMVVQFVLTERITGQENELDQLSGDVAALAQALGLEQQTTADLQGQVGALQTTLTDAQNRISALTTTRDAQAVALDQAATQITRFEAQVAALIAQRDTALGDVAILETTQAELLSDQEALNLALSSARGEIDAQVEAARLAAARRDALNALVADLEARNTDAQNQIKTLAADLDEAGAALSTQEAARLAEAAAAEALRARLANSDAELTAMTLALEAQRQDAENTLTLLAAARAVEGELDSRLAQALVRVDALERSADVSAGELDALRAEERALQAELAAAGQPAAERDALRAQLAQALAAKLAAETLADTTSTQAERRAALLEQARQTLANEQAASAAAQRQTELLNQQVAALRGQLGGLQSLLDDAVARDAASQVRLQSLGSDLNTALARVAAEERRRRELETAERERLEREAARLAAETKDLEQYRSEFFGRLRDVLGRQDGVRIEGDRFVFSSEVLFAPASANLSVEGQQEVAKVAEIISAVADDIPNEINWVLRVDGHTDNVPLFGTGRYADNWELSQGRALSVVKYMVDALGIPPERLAANGFGQYQPIAVGDTDEARAQNRRIELKFTEK
ncbi:peptidoglycan -binding protein [Roseobacter sp.]|uniref:peptidoglycan -binding protein n=1 Tax=Roseobacter sp. TaxID=1907202 RepID=UPI003296AE02